MAETDDLVIRTLLCAGSLLLIAACGSMNVVSDGFDSRLMLKGYDPVAYFTDGKPVLGKPDLKVDHQGVTYRFASDDHRLLFVTNAGKYVPQYGGWSANGMVYAIPIEGDPRIFKIIEGRLYLFGDPRSRLYFEMNQEKNLKLADSYWETEVRDSYWRVQSWKRTWFSRVPHFKSDADLAREYEKRFGRKPG